MEQRKKTNSRILAIAGIAALLLIILVAITGGNSNEGKAAPAAVASETPKIDRTKAYVIAKQFAKNHLGSADYGWADDGFTDYEDGTFHVTGVADIPGKRIRWTIELQYNGGEWSEIRNWQEKGWFAQ